MPLSPRDGLAIACAALAALAIGAAAYLMISSTDLESPAALASPVPLASATLPSPATSSELLVDVQGGVRRPGLVRLASGARVADAIAAAGGYSDQADLLAAAASVNLAAILSDGQQVWVPLVGVASAGGGSTGASGNGGSGGLVNLNTAGADALDALPGIGPATVDKILAARAEQPFATLDELVDRKVMNRGQLDGIRDLVTV